MLEEYLTKGRIYIGPKKEFYVSAVFVDDRHHKTSVESQKGINHALELLDVKLFNNKEPLIQTVEKDYPYPLNWKTRTRVDDLLEKTSIEIYLDNGVVCVDFYQLHNTDPSAVPGVHKHSARGTSILKILKEVAEGGFPFRRHEFNRKQQNIYY